MVMLHSILRTCPTGLLDIEFLKKAIFSAFIDVYNSMPPIPQDYYDETRWHVEKQAMRREGLFFPDDQERDFAAFLYHKIAQKNPELVEPFLPSKTYVMHCELGYNWSQPKAQGNGEKADFAFIDPSNQEMRYSTDADACENVRFLGFIELKRHVGHDFSKDVEKLRKRTREGKGTFGIVAAPYFWPYTLNATSAQKMQDVCKLIKNAGDCDLTFVSLDYLHGRPVKYPFRDEDKKLGFFDASTVGLLAP
jgi:hypothetical protein